MSFMTNYKKLYIVSFVNSSKNWTANNTSYILNQNIKKIICSIAVQP